MGSRIEGARFRWSHAAARIVVCVTTISLTTGLTAPVARSQESGSSAASLVSSISQAQARVDQLDLSIGELREAVNGSLVELHDVQARAEQARRGAEEAARRLSQSQIDVEAAQDELSDLTRMQYRSHGAPSTLAQLQGPSKQKDVLDRSLYLQRHTEDKRAKLDDVERARAEAANEESTLRLASEHASRTAQAAEDAQADARATLEESQVALATALAEREGVSAESAQKQEKLREVRPNTEDSHDASALNQPAEEPDLAHTAPPASKEGAAELPPQETIDAVQEKATELAPHAPTPTSEQITGALATVHTYSAVQDQSADHTSSRAAEIAAAVALVNSSQAPHGSFENPYGSSGSSDGSSAGSSQIRDGSSAGSSQIRDGSSAGSSQIRDGLRNFDSSEWIAAFSDGFTSVIDGALFAQDSSSELDKVLPDVKTSSEITQEIRDTLPSSSMPSQVETVIARATNMIGMPYVWGGGDATGPTTGLEGGGVRGYDCSGLVLYAFAGVGISLPHYTGDQYKRGTQIDSSDAKRGDLFFWGDGGSQHVAINLGDGTMLEAPQSGQNVQISPIRWSGMSPKAVRLL